MNDHKQHLDEIAKAAAALHGQEWKALPNWTRDRWIETVRHMTRGGSGVNEMERHAGQAIDDWYKAKEARAASSVEAETVEAEATPKQKTKKK